MRKETEGLLAQIQESGNVVNYDSSSKISIEDIYRFNVDLDKAKARRNPVRFFSVEMSDYLHAMHTGDDKKMREMEAKWKRENEERKRELYKKMKKELSWYGFRIFKKVDETFKRCRGYFVNDWTTEHSVRKTSLDYQDFEYYDSSKLEVRLIKGKYTLLFFYSDETGYDSGTHIIKENIKPRHIFKEIEKAAKIKKYE